MSDPIRLRIREPPGLVVRPPAACSFPACEDQLNILFRRLAYHANKQACIGAAVYSLTIEKGDGAWDAHALDVITCYRKNAADGIRYVTKDAWMVNEMQRREELRC
jgi:hypothetical protein